MITMKNYILCRQINNSENCKGHEVSYFQEHKSLSEEPLKMHNFLI